MIPTSEAVAVTCDWLVPVDTPPIPNGIIVIQDGIIRFVGQELPTGLRSARIIRLAGFAILPGLVNSHCHLEFSDLDTPIPAGKSFPDWIRSLLAFRRAKSIAPEQLAEDRRAAIASGIRESYQAGVRWVVDMATEPWSVDWIACEVASISAESQSGLVPKSPIVVQPCIELLDIMEHRFESTLAMAKKQMAAPKTSAGVGRTGLAPHSPYTASRRVTQWCADLSRDEHHLVTMHLAESKEELQWLQNGKGPFAELLGPILGETYCQQLGQIAEHVELLSQSWRATVAHGNYLSSQDLKCIAEYAATMGVVHCPRTHQFFGHLHEAGWQRELTNRYPLAERMASGVRHFLGTDSRASNPDLNLWTEAKHVRAEHHGLCSHQIMKMITTDAAEFLELGGDYGFVRTGAPAALTAVKLARTIPRDVQGVEWNELYDALLEEGTKSTPLERAVEQEYRNTHSQFTD